MVLVPDYTVLWAPYAVREGRRIAAAEGIDLLLANSPPYGTLVAARWLASVAGLKLVSDFKDVWVGGPLYFKQGGARRMADARIERNMLQNSARALFATENALSIYQERYQKLSNRFALIPNGVDAEDFSQVGIPLKDRFRVVISGLLNQHRDPSPVVSAFSALIEKGILGNRPELVFVGEVLPKYVQEAQSKLGDRFQAIPSATHREYIDLIASASALVIVPAGGVPSQVQGKLYEMAAVGRRTLVIAAEGATADLCRKYNFGTLVDPQDGDSVRDFLLAAYKAHQEGNVLVQPPVNLLEDFSRKRQTAELSDLLLQLMEQPKGS